MTDLERTQLRINCVQVFLQAISKYDIEKDVAFEKAEKLWVFATKLNEPEVAQGPVVKETQPVKRVGRPPKANPFTE